MISFFVAGVPVPKGSAKAFLHSKTNGEVSCTEFKTVSVNMQQMLFETPVHAATPALRGQLDRFVSKTTLLRGDCLHLMSDIPDRSIDMVCADLPFGTTRCRWDSVIDIPAMWEQYIRIIKDRGVIVLHAQTPFDKVLGASNLKMLRYEWIWEKGTATGHLNAKKAPMKAHENLLVFYKKLPKYHPIKTTGHKPMNAVYHNPDKSTDVYGDHCTTANSKGSTSRYPRSVLRFPVVTVGTLHPTQKPLALIEYLVSTYTDPGDTVLDNCMGSGTTGVACKNLGRNFIGIELDDKYYQIATKRIEAC